MEISRHWGWAALPLILIGGALVGLPFLWPEIRNYAFLAVVVLLALELVIIGALVNGRPIGAFIDNRNRISLSKLQAGGWTVIVLAGFATAAAFNAAAARNAGEVTALAVQIPGELLLAMGISATSLVATPALLSLKSQEQPAADARAQAELKLQTDVEMTGKVLTKAAPSEASWADLVTGEEVGNAGSPDLGKIQQAFITLLLLGIYTYYIFQSLADPKVETIDSLPTLDKSFVWLMGISHASYLAYKAAPHTKTEGR